MSELLLSLTGSFCVPTYYLTFEKDTVALVDDFLGRRAEPIHRHRSLAKVSSHFFEKTMQMNLLEIGR